MVERGVFEKPHVHRQMPHEVVVATNLVVAAQGHYHAHIQIAMHML
jgi:hypothetical protein